MGLSPNNNNKKRKKKKKQSLQKRKMEAQYLKMRKKN